jgi:mannose/fructose/N-acetylgalactosamine-specific phosphotransferase system component IID
MKPKTTLLIFAFLILMFMTLGVQAQKQYKIGTKYVSTLTYGATIAVTPKASVVVYSIDATGNATINATTTYVTPGDQLFFVIKSNTASRTITWGTGFTGTADALTSTKTHTIGFIWDGATFRKTGNNQND